MIGVAAAPGSIRRPGPLRIETMTTRPIRLLLMLGAVTLLALLPLATRAADPSAAPSGAAAPGATPLPVEVRDLQLTAGDRSFVVRAFTPALTETDGEARLTGGPWPVVVFGHGYLSPVDLYTTLLTDLAAAGYLVVAPTSGGELFPDHARFARDLSVTIDWLTEQNALAGGWLEGAVDLGRIAASGHSMGGGASILATAADPRIRSVANLAAAETRPSAIEAAAAITVPSLLISGSADTIAPTDAHQRPIFEAITDAPAQLRIITGGSHCGFIDDPSGSGLRGALTGLACDTGEIPRAEQLAITHRLLVDWLRWSLDGDAMLTDRVWSASPGDGTTIETHQP